MTEFRKQDRWVRAEPVAPARTRVDHDRALRRALYALIGCNVAMVVTLAVVIVAMAR